jgi:phospholipid/cholesterol/gamma-HCH transport system substrate-binding protein
MTGAGVGRRRSIVVALVVAVLAVPLAACSSGSGYQVRATFDDVGDLQARHSVQVADVRVGTIRSIHLTKDFKADVTMEIGRGHRIPRASQALLRTTSLLGEKFIELRPEGDPGKGPFLRDGDRVSDTAESPELEFVAEQAITVLSSVVSSDVATLVQSGAEAFGGRGTELHDLLSDLASISATLASRTTQIQQIIDNLDRTTVTLAAGAPEIADLLTNLADTTQVLADNRQRAITALDQLSRLARVQNETLDRYRGDIDRQIKQVDAVLAVAAGETTQLSVLIDWLDKFIEGSPVVVPGDFAQVYGWFIPQGQDPRPTGPAGNRVQP